MQRILHYFFFLLFKFTLKMRLFYDIANLKRQEKMFRTKFTRVNQDSRLEKRFINVIASYWIFTRRFQIFKINFRGEKRLRNICTYLRSFTIFRIWGSLPVSIRRRRAIRNFVENSSLIFIFSYLSPTRYTLNLARMVICFLILYNNKRTFHYRFRLY